jgi:hypothetical protein
MVEQSFSNVGWMAVSTFMLVSVQVATRSRDDADIQPDRFAPAQPVHLPPFRHA